MIAFQLQSSYQWGEHWSVPAHRYLALRNLPAGGKQEDLLGYHTVVWARMNDKDQKEANAAMKLLKKKVPDPKPIFSRIQKYLAANVGPSLDARFLRHANPLICGAHSLEMRVKYEEFGMRFANSYAVLSGMAQLYHALRHICYLNGTWPDMENLIAHHRKEIFFGMLPKEPQKMYSHVRLVSGTHSALISEEQRIQRSGRQPKSLNLRRSGRDKISWDLIPSKICAVLRDYFNGRDESARTLARLHGLAQEEKALSQGRVNHTASSRVVSNVQELKEFADYLQVALDRSFSIDYATLTRTCNALLKRIDEGIKTTLYAQNVRPEWHWKVPSLTGYTTVLNVLADIVVANANTQGVSRPDPPFSRNAREAVVAARILQEYIQAGAVGVSGENTVVGVTEFQRDKMPRRKVNVGGNARSGAQFVYDRNEEHRLVNRETKKDMARRAAAGQLG
ncbi:hypothetical protein K491DRAFT_126089 [Lophiostoma macrostomum CBS 122681]|uniref:Uncharacterized protein n=1 Tax=Lophiostoma macrostomum CBS 122681 TaxID=1314788 RepID=A0A6A6SS69_9PLEO|nr:hypothetical protein K491DRAFT_126089 [Lophiostoma macrostomum CBS 122681]